MKIRLLFICITALFLLSCEEDNEKRLIEQQKEVAKKEEIFKKIDKAWSFRTMNLESSSQNLVKDWAEWRLFLTELQQKPTSSIGAFQKKSKNLTQKADALLNTIPQSLSNPEFKSRFTVLLNHFRSLELYIHLDAIPEKKVIDLISDVNLQLASIELQMNELIRKRQIPTEQGEADMIRMLDTSRAVRDTPKNLD